MHKPMAESKQALLDLLKELKDVSGRTYTHILGLDLQLVMHKLNVKEVTRLIKKVS